LPTESGPVLAPPQSVNGMLQADWTLFLELVSYALAGHVLGRVALGIEEVAEAIDQGVVAVLFIPVSCGHCGERAVRDVVMLEGRGYIVGPSHELYEEIDDWGAAALLKTPLTRRPLKDPAPQPVPKRPRFDSAAVLAAATPKAASMAPPAGLLAPPVGLQAEGPPEMAPPDVAISSKDLRHDLKALGRPESLQDRTAIPRTTESVRDQYLPGLGANAVYKTFADVFGRVKGVAHRKAIMYVFHELFMAKKGIAMHPSERRMSGLEHFLLRVGPAIKGYKSDERQAYVKAMTIWSEARVLLPAELAQVKDAWDMD